MAITAKAKETLKNSIAGKSRGEFTASLGRVTEARGANLQYIILNTLEALAIDAGRAAGGSPSLGDHIMTQQAHKLANYGERTYPLSEKQVAVIVRENWRWVTD